MQETALRWLYIDFNSYFASVEQQLAPELRGRPIAVVPVQTDSTCAIAASYEAKAFGIRTGTPIHEARRLCPGLVCVLARHDLYVEYHHRLLDEIERHVHITAVCSIDEVACRLMDNEATPAAVARIARAVKSGIAGQVGEFLRCSIGAAPNRFLAKIAADMQKPDGFTVLPAQELPGRLLELGLSDLPGVGRNMGRRLEAAGITDMPALWALGPEQMQKIWGSVWGARMWHLLRAEDLPELATERRSIGHSHVLAPEMRTPELAMQVTRRLLLKACSRLRRMDYYASALSLSVRLEDGTHLHGEQKCFRAQDNTAFLRALEQMWREIFNGRTRRVKKTGIVLHGLVPAAAVAADLLENPGLNAARQKAQKLSRAMDRLNHRFGRDTVSLGLMPAQSRDFSGSKIAFTRIPDREEFAE